MAERKQPSNRSKSKPVARKKTTRPPAKSMRKPTRTATVRGRKSTRTPTKTRSAANRRKTNKAKDIAYIVILILLILFLLFLLGFGVYYIYNSNRSMALTMNGEELTSGQSIGALDGDVTFGVVGEDEYTVTVTAYASEENDFSFTIGEEPYTWHALEGRNITAGFKISQKDSFAYSTFTLEFSTFEDILEAANANKYEVTADELTSSMDIFKLTVKGSTETIEVTFGLYLGVEGITLTPENYIF